MAKLQLLVLGLALRRACGFASRALSERPSCSLRDTLFEDIFDNANGGRDARPVVREVEKMLPPENYNDDAPPFSASEGPRDRARRMEMARDLQKAFYKRPATPPKSFPSTTSSSSVSVAAPTPSQAGGPNAIPYGTTALFDLPTLTNRDGVEGAEDSSILPGYQYVWTIRNPRHCHMFHSILAGPAPWHFAHVYLPTSFESYKSSKANEGNDGGANDDGIVNALALHDDVRKRLESSAAPLYGTLLRITDRRFRDEDGAIVLAVQAIERVRIHAASPSSAWMPGTYLRTDVQLAPEEELLRAHLDKALLSSASYLSTLGDGATSAGPGVDGALRGAARAAAAADAVRVRRFEYLPVFLEEKPRRPSSAASLRNRSNDSAATRKVKDAIRRQEEEGAAGGATSSGPEYVSVVQLANYDSFSYSSLTGTGATASQALAWYWARLSEEASRGGHAIEEDHWWGEGGGVTDVSTSSHFLPEPSLASTEPPASPEATAMMEYYVWRTLDETIRLLSAATSATVPLPSQLLGLLPRRDDWPREFTLEEYARSLSTSGSSIGSTFASPFVRVDRVTSTTNHSPSLTYGPLRRARRLSYAIWLLLDSLAVEGAAPAPPPRHEVLGMRSVEERLRAAKETLEGINFVLKRMMPENRKDGDQKN